MTYIDDLGSTEPRCPECGVVMRVEPGGWRCPECGRVEPIEQVAIPPHFDGLGIYGG